MKTFSRVARPLSHHLAAFALLLLGGSAACGDDDASGDDDDDDGVVADAGPDAGGEPDGGEPDAGGVAPVDLVWVHGDIVEDERVQLAAYRPGTPTPAAPAVLLPATGSLAAFESPRFGSYSVSSDGRRVAFPADLDPASPAHFDLYVASVDGSNLRRVVDVEPPASVGKARLSPDGTFIAFTVHSEGPDNPLSISTARVVRSDAIDAVGVLVSPASPPDDVDDLVWADSTSIMVTGEFTESGVFELLITDVTQPTPTPTTLIGRDSIQADPAVVASIGVVFPILGSGGSILFRGVLDADNRTKLYRVAADGSGAAQVVASSEIPRTDGSGTFASIGQVGLSPDRSRIAFAADATPRVQDVWVMPVDGSAPAIQLTAGLVPPAAVNQRMELSPSQLIKWSRDGSAVAFAADYVTDNRFEPFVAPSEGGGQVRVGIVPSGASALAVAWSPDGTQLFLSADILAPDQNRAQLYVLEAATPDQVPALVFDVQPSGDVGADIQVSIASTAD